MVIHTVRGPVAPADLGRTLPHPLPTLRVNHVVSLTIHRLADWEGGRSIATRAALAQDLVDVSVGLLQADSVVARG